MQQLAHNFVAACARSLTHAFACKGSSTGYPAADHAGLEVKTHTMRARDGYSYVLLMHARDWM